MKTNKLFPALILGMVFWALSCVTNPFTGKSTMAFVNNSELFPSSFQQYQAFLGENTVVTGTADAAMVERLGDRIKTAAEKWLASEGLSEYLDGYEWEYHLVLNDEVNAWCMPGGKIVVYTGILPVTGNEDALAVVMGHEVAHALLNHGQQRMSADVLQQLGAVGVDLITANNSPAAQSLAMTAYGAGSQLFGTLPFSRRHESEADHYGLILMAIAGYDPDAAIPFWERMNSMGGNSGPEFLSTHPSDSTRISGLRDWLPEAKQKAVEIGAPH
jgi:predicted Zn-dependent protease